MEKVGSRRIAPMGWITAIVVGLLLFFEVLVMCGAVELRAGAVAKYAPWAYEPFLRLVGEHPESATLHPQRAEAEPDAVDSAAGGIGGVVGLPAEPVEVDLDVELAKPDEEGVSEPAVAVPEPEPATPREVVPVG